MNPQTVQIPRHASPEEILVESLPVQEVKLSIKNENPEPISCYSWEDLRGLSFIFEEDWA